MTSINETAEAVKAVVALKDAVAKHEKLIEAIVDTVNQLHRRIDKLEKMTPRGKR